VSAADSVAGGSRTDFHLGVSVAVLAALVAIVDVLAGRVGSAELLAVEEKVSAYQWFQAKSLKETVAEGRSATLRALLDGGVIAADHEQGVRAAITAADADAARYAGEKAVILGGGTLDGQAVTGARTLEAQAKDANAVGDVLDVARLLLDLSLLLGGVGVAVAHPRLERVLLRVVVVLGLGGAAVAAWGALLWRAALVQFG
jgi:hypothetical protein